MDKGRNTKNLAMKKILVLFLFISYFQILYSQKNIEVLNKQGCSNLLLPIIDNTDIFMIGLDNMFDVKITKPIVNSLRGKYKPLILIEMGAADLWLFNLAINKPSYFDKKLNRRIKKDFSKKYKGFTQYVKSDSIRLFSISYSDDYKWTIKCLQEIFIKNGIENEAEKIAKVRDSIDDSSFLDFQKIQIIRNLTNSFLVNGEVKKTLNEDSVFYKNILKELSLIAVSQNTGFHNEFTNRTLFEIQKIKEVCQEKDSLDKVIIISDAIQLLRGNGLKLVNRNQKKIDFTIAEKLSNSVCTIRIVTKKTKTNDLYPVAPKIIKHSYSYKNSSVLFETSKINSNAAYDFIYFVY